MDSLDVLVAGGGVGGLTAALLLARQGHRVAVFERAPADAEAGAGLQLSPNCARVLLALGFGEWLAGGACHPRHLEFRNWRSGRVIAELPLGDHAAARYGAPYYTVHRGGLLRALAAAARRSGGMRLLRCAPVAAPTQDAAGVGVSVDGVQRRGDVLIGADGIHSAVREALWGADRARFTGNIAWRALVPAARLPRALAQLASTVWWGPGAHFVHYPVRHPESGAVLVNCVGVVEVSRACGWRIESWTAPGERAALQADFAGWHDDLQCLIEALDDATLFRWALHDRAPMRRWGRGRITLLGDACHPMLPFAAQGAAMAIEDAAVLARCLAGGGSGCVASRLARYERLRRPRAASAQRRSRRNAAAFHLAGPAAWLRDRLARPLARRAMDRLYGYDPGSAP